MTKTPVFRNMGTIMEPPESPRKVIRSYFCSLTGQTKRFEKAVYYAKTSSNESVRRSNLIKRTPARPVSTGYHTKEEKRQEAAERNAAYHNLSVEEKQEKLDKGKFVASKQRAKLKVAASSAFLK